MNSHAAPAHLNGAASTEPESVQCAGRECCIARSLMTAANLLTRTADRVAAPLGLTSSRWLMLCAIARFDDPPSVSELSNETLLTAQNVSRMLASMEREGLVRRVRAGAGGRTHAVRLTNQGSETLEKTRALADRIEVGFLAGFSQERLLRLEDDLQALISNLCDLDGDDE
jgi:MarR family transcriptional regulator for hemolysin